MPDPPPPLGESLEEKKSKNQDNARFYFLKACFLPLAFMDEFELLRDNLEEVCTKGRKISSASALTCFRNKK